MNEQPKNIWKKSWTGWRGLLLGWLGLMIATLIIFWVIMLASGARMTGEELKLWALFAFGATIIFFAVLFIRWLCNWRNFKKFLFACACFATLIALFYVEEDWRGWHEWNKFKREWEAKGEHFDYASVVPPPVPDDQNFAMTPVVFTSYGSMLTRDAKAIPWKDRDTNFVDRLALNIWRNDNSENEPTNGFWAKGTITDLKPWQAYYRAPVVTNRNLTITTNEFPIAPQPQTPAQDVLLALSKYNPAIEELRQAGQLTYSRFPLEYDKDDPSAILLPHLADMKRCAQVLQMRGIAELQNSQPEKALDDVKLSFRLVDSIRTEPILISHLVRIAMLQIMLQPAYEGLAEHKWSDVQLADLDSELAKLDFLADYKLSMRGEMVLFQGGIFNYLRQHPAQLFNLFNYPDGENHSIPPSPVSWLIPAGWFYQNQLHCARPMMEFYLPAADIKRETISPAKIRAADAAINADTKHLTPNNIIERMLLPALGNAAKKFAYGQNAVNMARVAVALERCRLAYGEYPKSLDVLAPQFLEKIPHDIINGEPLHYRRTDDGQFVLYSVGWNERDDGGIVGLMKSGSVDNNKGDWVWRYPQK
jgi:hypothetical protein